jgi:hypothetical protein
VAQRASANRMIAAKGQTVTIQRKSLASFDMASGKVVNSLSTQIGKGVILPFVASLRKVAGTNIAATDSQCLLSALATSGVALTAPQVDDTLTDAGGTNYTITDVQALAPDGLGIMYELTVRSNP